MKPNGAAGRITHLVVRVLTLPPIVTGLTLVLMYAPPGLLTLRELLLCEVFLLLVPLAAYPLREIFHIGRNRIEQPCHSRFGYGARNRRRSNRNFCFGASFGNAIGARS